MSKICWKNLNLQLVTAIFEVYAIILHSTMILVTIASYPNVCNNSIEHNVLSDFSEYQIDFSMDIFIVHMIT